MARLGLHFANTHAMRRAFTAWLAVFALFVQALAPLSAAWASETGSGDNVQVICTASGVKTITVDQDGQPVNPSDVVSCPLCVVHSASAILTHHVGETFTHAIDDHDAYVVVRGDVHASLWRAQPRPPRGPPAVL